MGALTLGSAGAPHVRLFSLRYSLRFGGGRPLHNAQCSMSCNSTGDPALCLTISSLVFSWLFQDIQSAVFSLLRCSCRLASGSFIVVLPSGFTRLLFPGIRSPGALPASSRSSLVASLLRMCHCCLTGHLPDGDD
jgi:hypothetical protein